jgi:histidine phosphotransferase ChpT
MMSRLIDLKIVELLSARLCHELVSPIGAIANGVELLGEDDPEFVRDATALIAQSARKAAQRLQFYRFAYGSLATGSSGVADPRELVGGLFDGGKVSCEWRADALALPAEWLKLACNMVLLAAEALPRGGAITVAGGSSTAPRLEVLGAGEVINVSEEGRAALTLKVNIAGLTSRTVHGYFTARLAETLGAALSLAELTPDRLGLIAAVP